jgi:hypothetical protein
MHSNNCQVSAWHPECPGSYPAFWGVMGGVSLAQGASPGPRAASHPVASRRAQGRGGRPLLGTGRHPHPRQSPVPGARGPRSPAPTSRAEPGLRSSSAVTPLSRPGSGSYPRRIRPTAGWRLSPSSWLSLCPQDWKVPPRERRTWSPRPRLWLQERWTASRTCPRPRRPPVPGSRGPGVPATRSCGNRTTRPAPPARLLPRRVEAVEPRCPHIPEGRALRPRRFLPAPSSRVTPASSPANCTVCHRGLRPNQGLEEQKEKSARHPSFPAFTLKHAVQNLLRGSSRPFLGPRQEPLGSGAPCLSVAPGGRALQCAFECSYLLPLLDTSH